MLMWTVKEVEATLGVSVESVRFATEEELQTGAVICDKFALRGGRFAKIIGVGQECRDPGKNAWNPDQLRLHIMF
jgi:hypothetical protein